LVALSIKYVKTTTCTPQWVVSRRTNVFASRDISSDRAVEA